MSASLRRFERPTRLAVITNPDSGRNRRALAEVRRVLRRHAGVAQVEARDPDEMAAALAELADPPPDVLVLGLRPYWGPRHGAFFFSALRARPAHALRTLPSLFWGRTGALATTANGYYSQKADEVLLEVDGPITLDGEIYQASRERGAVRVSTGGWPSFLQI